MSDKGQMAAAFAAESVTPRDVTLKIAIAKFQNNGGKYSVALAMLNAAYDIDGRGLFKAAEESAVDLVPPSTAAGGQRSSAGQARNPLPSAAPFHNHAKRGLRAISAIQPTVSRSLFDSIMLPDGRALRQVRWGECPRLAARYRRMAHILTAVHNHAIPTDPSARLDTIVSEKDLAVIVDRAEKTNE